MSRAANKISKDTIDERLLFERIHHLLPQRPLVLVFIGILLATFFGDFLAVLLALEILLYL